MPAPNKRRATVAHILINAGDRNVDVSLVKCREIFITVVPNH